jgi:hypothetical protein
VWRRGVRSGLPVEAGHEVGDRVVGAAHLGGVELADVVVHRLGQGIAIDRDPLRQVLGKGVRPRGSRLPSEALAIRPLVIGIEEGGQIWSRRIGNMRIDVVDPEEHRIGVTHHIEMSERRSGRSFCIARVACVVVHVESPCEPALRPQDMIRDDGDRPIAARAEQLRDRDDFRRQRVGEPAHTGGVRIGPGEKARERLRGARDRRHGALEDLAAREEAVEEGRLGLAVGCRRDVVCAQRVDGEQQDPLPGVRDLRVNRHEPRAQRGDRHGDRQSDQQPGLPGPDSRRSGRVRAARRSRFHRVDHRQSPRSG